MEFVRWESIRTIGHDEFINEPTDVVVAMEKLDGMNVSVTSEYIAGRNGPVAEKNDGYRGWVAEGSRIQKTPFAKSHILYGEWLTSHTVEYKEEAMEKFYLFAAVEKSFMKEVSLEEVEEIAKQIEVETPEILFKGTFAELEEKLHELIGCSNLTKKEGKGEGIVILNLTKGFRTKKVTEEFRERAKVSFKEERALYVSQSIAWAAEYATPARIRKIIHKLIDEETIKEYELTYKNFIGLRSIAIEKTFEDIISEAEEVPENFVEKEALSEISKRATSILKEFLK